MTADNILVLSNGHIIEQGPHHDLLEANGIYAQMWALQKEESN
jgi:ATP-binding cassette subfamily B protein